MASTMTAEWRTRIDHIVRQTKANLDTVNRNTPGPSLYTDQWTAAGAATAQGSIAGRRARELPREQSQPEAGEGPGLPVGDGSIYGRINGLQEMVVQLMGQVRVLSQANDTQHKKIAQMDDLIGSLQGRLSESGVQITTETKLQRLHADVTGKLQLLERKLKNERLRDKSKGLQSKALEELGAELRVLRQAYQGDVDHLERELGIAKATLLRHESDVSAVVADNRTILQRYEQLVADVRILDEKERNQTRLVERCLDNQRATDSHFRSFRSEMRALAELQDEGLHPEYKLSERELLHIRPSLAKSRKPGPAPPRAAALPEASRPRAAAGRGGGGSGGGAQDDSIDFSLADYDDVELGG